tara:strand:- start:7 stop:834 length:828 start_codon:yes stop_codon:yes gene_type:complete
LAGRLLGLSANSGAQSASELLERGIYEEETAGDLEAAIKIYNQIVKNAEVDRPSIAQALYRLGMCYKKSGQDDAAAAAFEKLIEGFPEQEDLVEKARRHLPEASAGFVLEPVPWADDEVLTHVTKLPGGLAIGRFIWMANPISLAGEEGWRLRLLRYIGDGGNQGVSRVDVRHDNFAPVSGSFDHIGIVLGYSALIISILCLYVPSKIATAFGLFRAYVANSYYLQGIERGLEKNAILLMLVAAVGFSMGVLVILLHALALGDLWDRNLLPMWNP